jgi:hypothetical protein
MFHYCTRCCCLCQEVRAEAGGMLAETGTPGDPMLIALASVVVGYVE